MYWFIFSCLLGYHKARQLTRFRNGAPVTSLAVFKIAQHTTIAVTHHFIQFCGGEASCQHISELLSLFGTMKEQHRFSCSLCTFFFRSLTLWTFCFTRCPKWEVISFNNIWRSRFCPCELYMCMFSAVTQSSSAWRSVFTVFRHEAHFTVC